MLKNAIEQPYLRMQLNSHRLDKFSFTQTMPFTKEFKDKHPKKNYITLNG